MLFEGEIVMEFIMVMFMLLLVFGSLGAFIYGLNYVYHDAKARGMNAMLWLLVVFLLSFPVGFIVYFLARRVDQTHRCPYCGETIETHHSFCPHCGELLKNTCPDCGAAIQNDWFVCARCGRRL